jgi:hypothetical protein
VVADRVGIGTAPDVLAVVGSAVASWPEFARDAGVSASETDRVAGHHVPL